MNTILHLLLSLGLIFACDAKVSVESRRGETINKSNVPTSPENDKSNEGQNNNNDNNNNNNDNDGAGDQNNDDSGNQYQGKVESPTFSVAEGSYMGAQTVALSSTTPSAVIYYTTDGQNPTTASTLYTAPILVDATLTLKAIAVRAGWENSDISSADYTIVGTVGAPSFSIAGGVYTSAQSVTLSSATLGATVYYTLDGEDPTTSSTVYSSAISITETTTIKAFAVLAGSTDSAIVSRTYTITGKVATPTFSIDGGTYTSTQTVSLSSATPGATIYYTLNGQDPTTSSVQYTAPLNIAATTTVKAIAALTDWENSSVATSSYTITGTVATPTFSVAAGTYTSARTVTLASATPGATIYFTLNGQNPTTSSSQYSTPLNITETTTVKAIAVLADWDNSAIAIAAYTITGTVATPTFSVAAGTYSTTQSVSLSTSTPGATVYYTLDGQNPTTSSAQYSAPLSISETTTVKAIAVLADWDNSAVATVTYTITGTVATPTFSVAAGTYSSARTVSISTATAGATIYYTLDGQNPTTSSSQYSTPLSITETTTVKAIAVLVDWDNSAVATAAYIITGTVSAPTFSIAAGTYTTTQNVSLSTATPDATIYYTLDGENPTSSSTQYSAPISIATTTTIKAIAVLADWEDSSIASRAYTITGTVATPTFSVAAGTYTSARTVTLSTTTPGATIYYTLNGDTPTTSSTQYTATLNIASTTTVKAIAVLADWENSAVASAAYTITGTVATPTFSLAAGTYTTSQSVSLSTSTPGATIYYTIDGQNPTSSSTQYTGAISITSTKTVKAIAVLAGWDDSSVASRTYTITGTVATPTFSVAAGTYNSSQNVSISTSTPGATIYYTLDGQDPTTSSTQYSSAISITESTTVKAFAVLADWDNSAVATAAYTIEAAPAEPMVRGPQAATVDDSYYGDDTWYETNKVFVQDDNPASTYMYGMGGYSSQLLKLSNFGFEIPEGSTIIGIKVTIRRGNGYADWGMHTQDEIIQLLRNGALVGDNKAKASTNWPLNLEDTDYGSDYDLWSEVWDADDINSPNFGLAIRATAPGGYSAAFVDYVSISVNYEENPNKVKKPKFSIPPRGYAGTQSVSLSSDTSGTTIYYTLNGTEPTTSSTLYTGAISITSTTTIRAIAVKDGMIDSGISTGTFTIADGTSCKQILDQGLSTGNGVYTVVGEETGDVYDAYCDMTTDGGGWTLCFSDGHVKKGNTMADGYDFLTSIWKHGESYTFSTNNTSVSSYGNFCPDVMHSQVFARRFSDTSTLHFTTAIFEATGNLFVDADTRLVNGNDEIASLNKTGLTSPFYSGSTCEKTSNSYSQGTSLCVSKGSDYHSFMGNINSGMHGQGDYMCSFNSECGAAWNDVIQILVR